GKMEARIRDLEELLKHATVGEAPEAQGIVEIGTVITAEIFGDEERFLLGNREIGDGGLDVYSAESPLGAAILGLKVGDEASYAAPNGKQIEVKILAVDTYNG
ncbi:MAG: GreA/GreB family elongation factor, partial [Leucobacter sp.]|nr:GreA/GreB family elongation factor [Leucobacter sp.]